MKLNLVYLFCSLVMFFVYSCSIFGNGNDDELDFSTIPEEEWVYGHIEFLHDLMAPNLYFMKLLIHPDHPDAKSIDGYMSKDGNAFVMLRGVDTPRALHDASERFRPNAWRLQERESWDKAMSYVWNLTDPTHTFRVHNIKVVKVNLPTLNITHVIKADIQFFLGGNWHNLAVSMLSDEHARPLQEDGTLWDPGSKKYSLENLNNPR